MSAGNFLAKRYLHANIPRQEREGVPPCATGEWVPCVQLVDVRRLKEEHEVDRRSLSASQIGNEKDRVGTGSGLLQVRMDGHPGRLALVCITSRWVFPGRSEPDSCATRPRQSVAA